MWDFCDDCGEWDYICTETGLCSECEEDEE
jgi:hypothetical protein